MRSFISRSIFLCATALVACSDPVNDDARDALGPEQAGVPPGPLHRPGQPCVLCHGEEGPGDMVMSVAGTVYKFPDSDEPLAGAYVDFIDSSGKKFTAATNCAGNFFVQPEDFDPDFPIWTSLRYGGIAMPIEMSTPVFRERSCAGCHAIKSGTSSPGHVYFVRVHQAMFPPDGCK